MFRCTVPKLKFDFKTILPPGGTHGLLRKLKLRVPHAAGSPKCGTCNRG